MPFKGSLSNFTVLLIISFVLFAQPSWAGRVIKVKGKKVLILLDQEEVASTFKGDNLYVTTRSGKKRGIVTVRNMRGNKVIAQLRKGKAAPKMLTQPRKASARKRPKKDPMEMESPSEIAQTDIEDSSSGSEMSFGLVGLYGQATQNVTGIADMSGSLLGVKGVFDYKLVDWASVRARLGMDMLDVTGSEGGTDYATGITYITVDFLARANWMFSSSFGLYVNGGIGINSPMSTDLGAEGDEALDEDSISTTSVGILGGGLTIPMGSMEIYAGLDYYIYPTSENVETSVFAGKIGILFGL